MFILRSPEGDGDPGAGGGDQTPPGMEGAMNKGGTPPPASPSFEVPKDYANEEWAKNIKSPDDLFKQFANTQKLLGKKGIIVPGEKATPEEIGAFHKALGVPDTEDGYEFGVPEGMELTEQDKAEEKAVRAMMRKHGIPKKAAEGFVSEYRSHVFNANKEQLDKVKALDTEFDGYIKDIFGEAKDAKLAEFKEVVRKTLDPKFHALIPKMDNASAVLLAGLVENIHSKYGKAGSFISPKGGGSGSGRTQATITQELMALHTKYAGSRPHTPQYNEYVAKENELKQELDAMLSKR
ncbi:MAG: hypothetical protein EOL91_08230 [Actinobacteria bacterium]|nr:hypothetical protein [Actinomycetota bacterium]